MHSSGDQETSRVSSTRQTSVNRMVTSTGVERVQSVRKVSSAIVSEEWLGEAPRDLPVREVEVPGPVQEVIKHVHKKEIVETEKRVPRYEYEYVDRIVEVPRIEYIDRTVTVPQYQEVIREVKVPQVVDVPKEVVREVRIPKVNYVEQVREVPGEVITVPKPYTVEQEIEVARYTDRKTPLVVAQTIKPVIVESQQTVQVDVAEYAPQCIPVDIHVIKAVSAQVTGQMLESTHRVVTVPAAQYNSMLQQLNAHLSGAELQKLPYIADAYGAYPFLNTRATYTEPAPGVAIQGLDHSKMVTTHTAHSSASTTHQTTMQTTHQSGTHQSATHQSGMQSTLQNALHQQLGGQFGGNKLLPGTANYSSGSAMNFSGSSMNARPSQQQLQQQHQQQQSVFASGAAGQSASQSQLIRTSSQSQVYNASQMNANAGNRLGQNGNSPYMLSHPFAQSAN